MNYVRWVNHSVFGLFLYGISKWWFFFAAFSWKWCHSTRDKVIGNNDLFNFRFFPSFCFVFVFFLLVSPFFHVFFTLNNFDLFFKLVWVCCLCRVQIAFEYQVHVYALDTCSFQFNWIDEREKITPNSAYRHRANCLLILSNFHSIFSV